MFQPGLSLLHGVAAPVIPNQFILGPLYPSAAQPSTFFMDRVDSTRAMLCYQDPNSAYQVRCVVVTDTGSTPSFSAGTIISPNRLVRWVGALSSGKLLVLKTSGTVVYAQIVNVDSSDTITFGTEYTIYTGAASPNSLGAIVSSSGAVAICTQPAANMSAVGMSISGNTITSGTAVGLGVISLGGQGSAPQPTTDGCMVIGSSNGSTPNYMTAVQVTLAGTTVTTGGVYMAPSTVNRIRTDGQTGASAPLTAGTMAQVYRSGTLETGTTKISMSGGVATFSNTDANPLKMSASGFTFPVYSGTAGQGRADSNPSRTKVVYMWRESNVWMGILILVGTTLPQSANKLKLQDGTNSYAMVPATCFLTDDTMLFIYIDTSYRMNARRIRIT